MDEKLTRKSQEALSEAVKHAAVAGNPNVDGPHLLAALLQQEGGTADPLLRAVGADPAAMLAAVIDRLVRQPAAARPHPGAAQAPPAALLAAVIARLARQPQAAGATVGAPQTSRQLLAALATAGKRAQEMQD